MKLILFLACPLVFVVALGENVSVSNLSREFANAVNTIEGPRRLAVNVPTTKFAREFTSAMSDLLVDLVLEYYRQARLATGIVANEWKLSASTLLTESARVRSADDSTHLEAHMRDVCQQLNKFLLMQSRSSRVEASLPKIPSQTGPILAHYENYEPVELFNDLEILVDRDLTSIHHLVEKVYSKGWQGARLALGNVQQQFRNEFLHCVLLNGWIEDARRIDEASETLRKRVRPETWREYETLRERLKLVGNTVPHDREFCQLGAARAFKNALCEYFFRQVLRGLRDSKVMAPSALALPKVLHAQLPSLVAQKVLNLKEGSINCVLERSRGELPRIYDETTRLLVQHFDDHIHVTLEVTTKLVRLRTGYSGSGLVKLLEFRDDSRDRNDSLLSFGILLLARIL